MTYDHPALFLATFRLSWQLIVQQELARQGQRGYGDGTSRLDPVRMFSLIMYPCRLA